MKKIMVVKLGVVLLSLVAAIFSIKWLFHVEAILSLTADDLLVFCVLTFLAWMVIYMLIYVLLPPIVGTDQFQFDKHGPYPSSYECAMWTSLPCQKCTLDAERSQLTVALTLQFTRAELASFHRIMGRGLKASFKWSGLHFPAPLGDVDFKLSRRLAKRILAEMDGNHPYVLISWRLQRDYFGEPVPDKDVYVALRDIRRIRRAWPQGQQEVIVGGGDAQYRVSEVHLQAWEQMLDGENEYISILS